MRWSREVRKDGGSHGGEGNGDRKGGRDPRGAGWSRALNGPGSFLFLFLGALSQLDRKSRLLCWRERPSVKAQRHQTHEGRSCLEWQPN